MRHVLYTYLVTCVAYERRPRFQTTANATVAHETLLQYAQQGRYELQASVVMPDHLHAVITPSAEQSLETCVQLIKGGTSFRLRGMFRGTLWQKGHHDHRIRTAKEFAAAVEYIRSNPERRGLQDWPFVFTSGAKTPSFHATLCDG